jgi:hypothetical protein
MIENTSDRDPLTHFVGMLGGSDRYIEGMEAAGQREVVNSAKLPTEIDYGTESDVEALGITLGPVDSADALFRDATLPDGWSKQSTDHSMWSNVVDQHGRTRLKIFYKAAYYDRRAGMSVQTVYGYAGDLIAGAPLHLDEWATARGVIEALRQHRDQYEGYAARRDEDGYWASQVEACDRAIDRVSEAVSP